MTPTAGVRGPVGVRPHPPSAAGRLGSRWLFGLFASLLAASLILHQLWWNGIEVQPSLHVVVIVTAFWVLARPSSVGRFALMLAAEVAAVAHDLPYVGDHTLVVFLTAALTLTHLGWVLLRARRLPGPAEVFDALAPFLRVALIIVYAAAALSKLNSDFIDPRTSCAAPMSAGIAWFDPSLMGGTWRVVPSIWATIVAEIALPILLAIPRTRALALILGCAFHVVLALAGNVPFSALALALYVAFLPTDTVFGLRPSMRRRVAPTVSAIAVASGVGAWVAAAHLLAGHPELRADLIADGTRGVVVAMVATAAIVYLRRRRRNPSTRVFSGTATTPVFAVGVALLILNAASPYLGLKSESTFTMFSNLRTEQGTWNHLIIPKSLRVFPFQDETVSVVGTDDPVLAARTRNGTRLTRFEFDRYLHTHARATVTWRVGDTTATRSRGPVDARPGETLAEKMFHFKDIRPADDGDCG